MLNANENASTSTFAQLQEFVGPAKAGDIESLAQIRQVIDDNPAIRQQIGDLGVHVERAWLSLIAGQNPQLHELLTRSLDEMREDLAGNTSSPLERLLVDQVVVTWLQVRYFELVAAAYEAAGTARKRFKATTYQRLSQSQHRLFSSIKALNGARSLLGDGRQIRLAGPWSGEHESDSTPTAKTR